MACNSFRSACVISIPIIFAGLFKPVSGADGHCTYELHSRSLGESLKVCQSVDTAEQCGVLLKRRYDRSRAHAVRKKGRKFKYVKGECSSEAVVGICSLPGSRLFFYEGDVEALAEGCDRMKGRWEVARLGNYGKRE